MPKTLDERLDALSGPSGRISRAYTVAAWLFLAAALFWTPFAAAATGFMLGGFMLRREGL